MNDHLQRLERLSERSPLISRKEALAAGVTSDALTGLTRAGDLLRVGRGLYQLAGADAPSAELVEVSRHHPKGVICLVSALVFHEIGTQRASEVWLQLPINSPMPKMKWPPLRVIWSQLPEAFTEGVEAHIIGGHSVDITSVDRTIVDCFKHRSLVGLDVALEALRERMANRQGANRSLRELHKYARIMRVEKVMRPYMEALV